jgi:hypothetical protein
MAISLVQAKSATGTSATSLTVTLNSNTTAGNCLVVCVGTEESTDNPTVSGITLGGSAGNFASASTAYNNTYINAAIWIDPDCAGGQTSVVISMTGGTGSGPAICAWVMEFSGVATSAPLDKAPAGQNNQAATWTSGSTGTLSQASEIAIGCVYIDGSPVTPGSPWTELALVDESGYYLAVGYQVVSATTALTYNGTTSGSDYYGSCIITLKAAAAPVTVNLLTATVAVAAYPPGITTGPITLPVASVAVTAYPVTVAIYTAVALDVASVAVAARSPGIMAGPIALPVAAVSVTARTPTARVSVALATATVAIAAHSPLVLHTVALHTATVTIAAPVPTVVITSPVLVFSIAANGGTDVYGNPYLAGICSYSTDETPQVITQIYDGNLVFQAPTAYPDGTPAFVEGVNGGLYLLSGAETDETQAEIEVLSATKSGTGSAEVVVNDANLNMNGGSVTSINELQTNSLVLNGQTISVPQGSPPTVPGAPSSYTSTWGTGIVTALNYLIAVLQDAGIVS